VLLNLLEDLQVLILVLLQANLFQLRKSLKLKKLLIYLIMMEEHLLTQKVSSNLIIELKESINALGIEAKAEAVWHMIAEIDKDGSGQLEFD